MDLGLASLFEKLDLQGNLLPQVSTWWNVGWGIGKGALYGFTPFVFIICQ